MKTGIKIVIISLIFCIYESNTYAAEIAESAKTATPSAVLIFISFSMPPTSLRQWFLQAKKINAALVIRGLVEDSFSKTQQIVSQFSNESHNGVIIDPRLFQFYKITQVPAVVVRDTSASDDAYAVVIGDVGLETALSTLVKRDDSISRIARDELIRERAP